MIEIRDDGSLAFEIRVDHATRVEVVGAFEGWDEQILPMQRDPEGVWRLTFDPGPGVYLFRYRIDGDEWRLDEGAHGRVETQDGVLKSRIYCPGFDVPLASSAA